MGRATGLAIVLFCLHACNGDSSPSIAGTWSGEMMLDAGNGAHTFAEVEVTFTQDGDSFEGSWRTIDGTLKATGLVTGTIAREDSRQAVNVRFTYAGRHPGRSGAASCVGSARAAGQLVYNTTVDVSGQPPPEATGWGIRLKAFEGFTFDSCPAIGYATWTLTRRQ